MRYIKRIDEYFSERERLELKDITGTKEYYDLTYNKYSALESPTGTEVNNDLKFTLSLFPELTVRQLYPLFTLIINNKKFLKEFNYDGFVGDGTMTDARKLFRELGIYIKQKQRVHLKTFIPKDTDLERQIKSINSTISKRTEWVTKDTLYVNQLYKLLKDTNIEYLSIFYKIMLNGIPYDTIVNYIKSLLSINSSMDELKGNLNNIVINRPKKKTDEDELKDVLDETTAKKQLEFLEDYNRNAKIGFKIEELLKDNLYYKDDKNKSVMYNYVWQLIFQENIPLETDYIKNFPVTKNTENVLKTATLTDFNEFIKEVKSNIKGPENRDDVYEILERLGKDEAQLIRDVNDSNYNYVIVLSKSYTANKELTCGTSWCTATSSAQAASYTVMNMDYYIFNYKAKEEDHKIIGLNFDPLTKVLSSITYKKSNEVGINKASEVEKIIGIKVTDDSIFCKKDDIINKILAIYKKVGNDILKKYKEILDSYNIKDNGFELYYEFIFKFTPKGTPIETFKYYGVYYDPIKKILECNVDKPHIDYLGANDVIIEELWGNIDYNE